jgi:hypothetical protein
MGDAYNYTYADMMLTIGGKVMIVIIVILILFFGSDTAQFQNANSVREFIAMSKKASSTTTTTTVKP